MVNTKNFQIIDGAENSTFSVFNVEVEIFNMLFPNGTDVAFLDDVEERLALDSLEKEVQFWGQAYKKLIPKSQIKDGIHGTLHLDSSYCNKKYFPTRKESEVIEDSSLL